MGTGVVLAGNALAIAAVIVWQRKRPPSGSCSIDDSCGCRNRTGQ